MKNIKDFKNFGRLYENQLNLFSEEGVRQGHFTTSEEFLKQFNVMFAGLRPAGQKSTPTIDELDDNEKIELDGYVASSEEAASGASGDIVETYEEMIKQGVLDFLMSQGYISDEDYREAGGDSMDLYSQRRADAQARASKRYIQGDNE